MSLQIQVELRAAFHADITLPASLDTQQLQRVFDIASGFSDTSEAVHRLLLDLLSSASTVPALW